MTDTQEFQGRIARIEGLLHKLEAASDPNLRTQARDLVQTLMELHAKCLDRILEEVSKEGEAGTRVIDALGRDPLVSSLLVLYNLHPEDFETRVRRGIEKARMSLRSAGVSLDVISVDEHLVRVRIIGTAAVDLEAAVRDALYETAPDAANVVIEGGKMPPRPDFVPLASLENSSRIALVAADTGRP